MICIAAVGGMARRMVVVLVAVGLAAAAFVACGGGGMSVDGPTATVPTLPPTTADPYAVPAVIDEAYVNRVLAALDAAVGDVVRIVVSTRTIPPEALERLKAIYVDRELLQLQVNIIQDSIQANFTGLKIPPGNRKTTITRIISATADCIFAEVHSDATDVATNPDPSLARQWIALTAIDSTSARLDYNRTSWGYTVKGFQRDHSAPADPCA